MHDRFTPTLVAVLIIACVACAQSGNQRVLVIGDSWANAEYPELQSCFSDQELNVAAVNGAVPGILAATMAMPADIQRVNALLVAHPTIDTVQFTVGLNDFLGNWNAGLSKAAQKALFDQIEGSVVTVLNALFAQRPSLHVIMPSYDFLNFEDLRQNDPIVQLGWTWLGSPTPHDLNSAMMEMDERKKDLADSDPRLTYCDLYGTTQRIIGYPDLGIPPHSPSLPDDLLPTPQQAMNNGGTDPIHLGVTGYFVRAALLYHGFYRAHFGFFAQFPGSEEDLVMQVGVNGDTSAASVRTVHAGDIVDVFYGSLFGTFVGANPAVVIQTFYGTPPTSPPAFPEVHVNSGALLLDAGYDSVGPVLLPDEGRFIGGLVVQPGFAGTDVIFQGFAVSAVADNGFFASTPGIVLEVR